jgi:hypothetical protein
MTIFSCTFRAPGNPDHGQYAPVAPNKLMFASDIETISKAARLYITYWDLGGGNWGSPVIYDDTGAEIGNVSYNGRIWPPGAWHRDMQPIYDPCEMEKANG